MAKRLILNLNDADLEALQQLPGIGKSLAERIIEGRPYEEIDDLLAIQGLGRSKFERIKRHVDISKKDQPEEALPTDEGIEAPDTALEYDPSDSIISADGREMRLSIEEVGFSEKLSPDVPAARVELKPPKPKMIPARKTLSRAETLWLVFGVGIIAILLSVITTLVIVAGINNTLDFNRLQSIQDIDSNLAILEREIVDLSNGLDSIERRVQPLEGLSGRVVIVEDELGSVQGDVNEALLAVNAMQADLDLILTETARLSDRVVRFDNFLDGLEELIRVISNTDNVE